MTNKEKTRIAMDNKTKALDIAMSLIDCELPTLEKCRKSALDMAQYKEQEIIEKASLFFIDFFKELPNGPNKFKIKRDCSIEQLIEYFKKAIEE